MLQRLEVRDSNEKELWGDSSPRHIELTESRAMISYWDNNNCVAGLF
jgi:hypothetical protein